MLLRLILLMTIVPLAELLLLLRLAGIWGFTTTVAVVLGTGLAGAALARAQGLKVLANIRARLQRGELPADDLLDGMMILVAAALLVTPGVMTDAAGLLLLVPAARAVGRKLLKRWLAARMVSGQAFVYREVEYRPIDEEPPPGSPPLEGPDEPY